MQNVVDILNNKFIYHDISKPLLSYIERGLFEPGLANFILEYCKKDNMIFYDCGANFGYFSIMAGKTNPELPIISFEPSNIFYDLLVKNIILNELKNIQPYKLGLSNKNGEVEITSPTTESGISLSYNPEGEKETIQLITLDDFVEKYDSNDRIRIVKLDCEAEEYNIISGSPKFFNDPKTVYVVCEFINVTEYKVKLYNLLKDIFPYIYVLDSNLSIMSKHEPIVFKKEMLINKDAMNLLFSKVKL